MGGLYSSKNGGVFIKNLLIFSIVFSITLVSLSALVYPDGGAKFLERDENAVSVRLKQNFNSSVEPTKTVYLDSMETENTTFLAKTEAEETTTEVSSTEKSTEVCTTEKLTEVSTTEKTTEVTTTEKPTEPETAAKTTVKSANPTKKDDDTIVIDGVEYVAQRNTKITYYCPCYKCSEGYGNGTSCGKTAKAGRTVAMPSNIPFGTKIYYNGHVYICEDRGGAITSGHIDIYCDTHSECYQHSDSGTYQTIYIEKH